MVPTLPLFPRARTPRATVHLKSFAILFPLPESRPPRDLDLEVFCDSVEQLEPELGRLPVLSPVPVESELSHLPPGTQDSVQQVWPEQKEAAGRELATRSSPESPGEKSELSTLSMLLVPEAFPGLSSQDKGKSPMGPLESSLGGLPSSQTPAWVSKIPFLALPEIAGLCTLSKGDL